MTPTQIPDCTLANAAWHANPYPFYAALREQHRAGGLFFDPASRLWVACTAAAVREALQAPALRVRPLHEPVPAALQGRPSGRAFGGLMRMNEGQERHERPKAWALQFLAGLPAQVAALRVPDAAPQQANDAIFDGPLMLLAQLLGLPEASWQAVAQEVRRLVAGWAAGADAATLQQADAAAESLLARFEGDANRIGLFTQTCDATAALTGIALTAWQADAQQALDADGLAVLAQRDAPVQNTRRFVAEPVVLRGQALQPGDTVLVLLASANHDGAQAHGWGHGRHACPGERLSQTLAAALLQHWLAQDADGWRAATATWTYRPSPNARIPLFTA
jgi:cytochrome P450